MQYKANLKLQSIHLRGFKSISPEGQSIDFNDLTILLGANGAGKSNLVSFFSLLNSMMTGALQNYVGESGSASSLLHYGPKKTPRIAAEIKFTDADNEDAYQFSLSHAPGDTLIFTEETIVWKKNGVGKPCQISLDPGLKESGLKEFINRTDAGTQEKSTARIVFDLLKNCQVFQFHDTSKSARIRNKAYLNDNQFLNSDGGNLAAFLHALKNNESHVKYYNRIVRHVSQVMPQFSDFELSPSALNKNYILLNWKDKNAGYLFGTHQISDGSLRFMALTALLLQPPETLPSVVVLDEPELGLHPSALSILAGMVRTASKYCQVVLATQSQRLVDEFEPENMVVVEWDDANHCSEFKRLDEEKLDEWLERYSLSELWEKNVIAGDNHEIYPAQYHGGRVNSPLKL